MDEPLVPPPDVRNLIDRAISVAASDGPQAVKELVADKPHLFGFLHESDAYFAWFQWRQSHPDAKSESPAAANKVDATISAVDLSFTHPDISPKTLAVIKAAAKYTAKNPKFSNQLEELRPGQFRFLEKDNRLYPIYLEFVRQYQMASQLQLPSVNWLDVLTRALRRAELEAEETRESEIESREFYETDWRHFTVIETVQFRNGETLPKPAAAEDLKAGRLPKLKEATFISPFTGEKIPASQYDEHVRVLSLKEQVKQQKEEDTSYLDISNAADNLKRLATSKDPSKRSKHII